MHIRCSASVSSQRGHLLHRHAPLPIFLSPHSNTHSYTQSDLGFRLGFPGVSDGKDSACNVGDLGSIPGGGIKIPHATGQLSPHAVSTEVCGLEPALHNRRSHPIRRVNTQLETRPCSPQLEKACAQQQRPSTVKINNY